MKSRSVVTKIVCLLTAGVMAAGALSAASPNIPDTAVTCQVDRNFPAEASQLLKEVQFTAAQLNRDAAILQSFSRSAVSREGHVSQVTMVKHHINTIGEQLIRLQAIRHLATPWQQQAIDSVAEPAGKLAAHTQAAIEHLNNRQNTLWHPVYAEHLRGIYDRADQVKEAVNLHLETADTQDKLERLQERTNALGS
jgi:hypothetical protein